MPCTSFEPPPRCSQAEIERQAAALAALPHIQGLLDAVPMPMLVLNGSRQVVLANRAFAGLTGDGRSSWLGLRVGEALRCVNVDHGKGGCGTSEFCHKCGAAASLFAVAQGRPCTEECRITRMSGEALDLQVSSTPLRVAGESYSFFCLVDQSAQKRRRVLERLFFHDVLNMVNGLHGFSVVLAERAQADPWVQDMSRIISHLSSSVMDDVQSQRELVDAESGELRPEANAVDSVELLRNVKTTCECTVPAFHRELALAPGVQDFSFLCDHRLLRRVLVNMAKNALEASQVGQVVTLDCHRVEGVAVFSVHNFGCIPRDVQLQIFRRSFSTKGAGRGLGTYSIQLFGEKYLEGRVSFTSDEPAGTTFTIQVPLRPSYFDS